MTTEAFPAGDEASTSSIHAWIAPSIPALIFVCVAVFVPVVAQTHLLNGDGDLARHLRHGLYMIEHRSLIWRDPFSYSRAGQPFVPFEYGSQLIYALVYLTTGLAGVAIFAGVLIATAYSLMARLLLRRGVDTTFVVAVTFSAILLGSHHWLARPHLLSWVAAVVLYTLIESGRRPALWVYPIVFALWANIHGGWLYGIALLCIYAFGNVIEYWKFDRTDEQLATARHFIVAVPLAVVATLLTPMGLGLWRHLYTHLGDSYVISHTSEFGSPEFHSFSSKVLLLIILGTLAALVLSSRRVHPARLLVIFAGVWWALVAARNLPLLGLTGLAAAALHLDYDWRRIAGGPFERWRQGVERGATNTRTAPWILCCSALLLLVATNRGTILGRRVIANSFNGSIFPVEAVHRARDAQLSGRLFTDFTWGGYVLYAWPEQRVFVDGGTDFYGEAIAREYLRIASLEPGWRRSLREHGIEIVMTQPQSLLARGLMETDGWSLWYCDSVAAIIRRSPTPGLETAVPRLEALAQCEHTAGKGG